MKQELEVDLDQLHPVPVEERTWGSRLRARGAHVGSDRVPGLENSALGSASTEGSSQLSTSPLRTVDPLVVPLLTQAQGLSGTPKRMVREWGQKVASVF